MMVVVDVALDEQGLEGGGERVWGQGREVDVLKAHEFLLHPFEEG
jgi:hypothetical protein